jgi:hypothetical protein
MIIRTSADTPPLTIAAPRDADRLLFADITNDRIPDLLFFGRKTAGILVSRGTADGFHAPAMPLLPDISVSDIATTDLNGDMIADLFVADWLSNKVILYLGIGRGVFSEQVSVVLPGEPLALAFHPGRAGKSRIAVSMPDLKQIQLFTINALGEFRPETILSCPGPPQRVRFADIDTDGSTDLITATEGELVVFPQIRGRFIRDPFLYAAGGKVTDWMITDLDGDRKSDAVIATKEPSRLVFLGNSFSSGSVDWPPTYAVGRSPRGLTTGDFDSDGTSDLAVVSATPGTLCLLMGGSQKPVGGPVFLPVGENPFSVKFVGAAKAHGPAFVLSHFPSSHVTVLRTRGTAKVSSFEIPTALNPLVLTVSIGPSHDKLSIVTRNRGEERRNLSLSLFDEISEAQFIETSLRPNPPRRVTSITAFDMSRDGYLDLVFSTFESNRGESAISLSLGVDRFSFSPHNEVFSFPDTLGTVRFIRAAFMDNDPFADIVVVLGAPMASVLMLYGSTTGVRDSVEWVRNVDIPREDALLTEDLNNDGNRDLCFVDLSTQSVIAVDGRGNGSFTNRRPICPAEGVVALTAGSFSAPGAVDLWLSNEERGTVTLVSNPF